MGTDGVIVVGIVAGLVGLAVVVVQWLGARRSIARSRHPSASIPVRLELQTDEEGCDWLVTARESSPPVTVDILIHRPSGSVRAWSPSAVDHPIDVEPGGSVRLPSAGFAAGVPHDVILAWTSRTADGDVQETRSLTVGPDQDVAVERMGVGRDPVGTNFAMLYGAVGVALALVVLVAGLQFDRGSDTAGTFVVEAQDGTLVGDSVDALPPAATMAASPLPPSSSPSSTSTGAPSTSPPSRSSAVVADASLGGSAETARQTETTAPPPVDGDRRVLITGRVEDCRFGPDCVIASFALDGFVGSGRYVCEFGDGSRFEFGYDGAGSVDACRVTGAEPAITIEVDGVRSRTITRDELRDG